GDPSGRAGALLALMPALHSPQAGPPKQGGPARLVTHHQMGSPVRHPILPPHEVVDFAGTPVGTARLERRALSLRPGPHLTVTVH
ncbi:MAG: hypothetical protein M3072_04515, partial [Candidatus Dormibacteraeota bacterium]|nr:hypothetical protein [Candidatus Dormibacteraeota bacterium]